MRLSYHSETQTDTCSNPQIYQSYLDKSTPYAAYRWISTAVLLALFFVRIVVAQGWYIGSSRSPASPPLSTSHNRFPHFNHNPKNQRNKPTNAINQYKQSATRSESTFSTFSSPSSNLKSTPPSPKMKAWKTATQAAACPQKRTRNSALSSDDYPNSSSGTRRREQSPSVSCVHGSQYSMSRSSGRCLSFISLSCFR